MNRKSLVGSNVTVGSISILNYSKLEYWEIVDGDEIVVLTEFDCNFVGACEDVAQIITGLEGVWIIELKQHMEGYTQRF